MNHVRGIACVRDVAGIVDSLSVSANLFLVEGHAMPRMARLLLETLIRAVLVAPVAPA